MPYPSSPALEAYNKAIENGELQRIIGEGPSELETKPESTDLDRDGAPPPATQMVSRMSHL